MNKTINNLLNLMLDNLSIEQLEDYIKYLEKDIIEARFVINKIKLKIEMRD